MPIYVVTKNLPIACQIKNFQNKKSGKVTEARRDIQHRFACLDWKDQKKILNLFLESGQTDRDWAYSKLLWIWDDSFTEKIKTLWDKYHEYKCSWVIIRHLPKEFILEKMQEIDIGRNYYFISLRLSGLTNWEIDKEKLSIKDYLSLCSQTERSMDDLEVLDLLFRLVHDKCVEGPTQEDLKNISYGSIFSATSFSEIRTALYHVYGIGCNQAAVEFEKWNEAIQLRITESKDYHEICETPMSDRTYQTRIYSICIEYIYTALHNRYKKADDPSIEQMKAPFAYYTVVPDYNNDELPF